MTPRQTALLEYHRDVAAFGTSTEAPVFVNLDLDDSVGFEIASNYQPNCAAAESVRFVGSASMTGTAFP